MDSNLNLTGDDAVFTDIQITIWRIQQLEELKKKISTNSENNNNNQQQQDGHTFIFPELLWPDKDLP